MKTKPTHPEVYNLLTAQGFKPSADFSISTVDEGVSVAFLRPSTKEEQKKVRELLKTLPYPVEEQDFKKCYQFFLGEWKP